MRASLQTLQKKGNFFENEGIITDTTEESNFLENEGIITDTTEEKQLP